MSSIVTFEPLESDLLAVELEERLIDKLLLVDA